MSYTPTQQSEAADEMPSHQPKPSVSSQAFAMPSPQAPKWKRGLFITSSTFQILFTALVLAMIILNFVSASFGNYGTSSPYGYVPSISHFYLAGVQFVVCVMSSIAVIALTSCEISLFRQKHLTSLLYLVSSVAKLWLWLEAAVVTLPFTTWTVWSLTAGCGASAMVFWTLVPLISSASMFKRLKRDRKMGTSDSELGMIG
ncbi:hypothetical protein HII31_05082 [Pseudocercospora fuligena]|uniref:Uncharacterized protein n=1 Tax=Pseudocercospora fuligena TaxID=685502 RepID=A0A8H6VIF8_9PEZI|nr:hypothetical protein HII31_05082 [Pseudocercospora fuligena]